MNRFLLLIFTFYLCQNLQAQTKVKFDFGTNNFSVTNPNEYLKGVDISFNTGYLPNTHGGYVVYFLEEEGIVQTSELNRARRYDISDKQMFNVPLDFLNKPIKFPLTIKLEIVGVSSSPSITIGISKIEEVKATLPKKIPFFDAVNIVKLADKASLSDIINILKKYDSSITDINDAITKFGDTTTKKNHFLAKGLMSIKKAIINSSSDEKRIISVLASDLEDIESVVSSQNLDTNSPKFSSKAINALGTFIANRFKQELNIAFLEKFREMLDKYEELEALFPKTYNVLKNNEPYNFTTFLQTLRDAFQEDLDNMTGNLRTYLQKKYSENPKLDILAYLLTINEIANGMAYTDKKIHTSEIINNIDEYGYLEELSNNNLKIVGNSFKLLALISRNISTKNDQGKVTWISAEDLKVLMKLKAESLRNLFIGLLIDKESTVLKKIEFDSNGVYDIITTNKISIFNEYIGRIIFKVIDLEEIANNEYYKSNGETDNFKKFYNYSKGITAIISTGVEGVLELGVIEDDSVIKDIKEKYIPTLNSGLDMTNYIRNKEYGLAINSAYEILKLYIEEEKSDEKKYIVPSYILKYGNFIASMAVAESSDEMLKILETAALPVGSYRIKRNSLFNISLNAYAGVFGGLEWFNESEDVLNNQGIEKYSATTGFTAPVGISFSWGRRKTLKGGDENNRFRNNFKYLSCKENKPRVLRGSSWSLFVSVIDVGAVTSFQLTNDDIETLPEFTWENVLAPGAFLIYGFKNNPLSIMAGIQYGPQIRSIKDDLTIDNDALRSISFRIGLTVDIPIFSIYTKNEKRTKN